MDILSLKFLGAALDHPDRLAKAQSILQGLKQVKLEARLNKHHNVAYSFSSLILHLEEELAEFKCAVADGKHDNALEELADMSNMVDILAITVIGEPTFPKPSRAQ